MNPVIWDCGCQPSTCDTLLIMHAVVATGSATFTNAFVLISADGVLTSLDTLSFTGRFENQGLVDVHRLVQPQGNQVWSNSGSVTASVVWLWGDSVLNTGVVHASDTLNIGPATTALNHGLMEGDFLWSGGIYNYDTLLFSGAQMDWPLVNSGYCRISGLLINLLLIANETSGVLNADSILCYGQIDNRNVIHADSLLQFGTDLFPQGEISYFPNTARIECGNLKNHGDILGQGDICVRDSTINYATGTITGSPDICDATMNAIAEPFLDLNLGVVGNGVNWCDIADCATGIISHNAKPSLLSSFPVPASDVVRIVVPRSEHVAITEAIRSDGVMTPMPFTRGFGNVSLDVRATPDGVYQVRLKRIDGALIGIARIVVVGR
ncbi:MAG: hypothetical protein IPG74_02255 [Flavobacteriales bacterium]|nr:hypothetical protein [Flavobacteriales bacterium]MBK7553028.1 hypothetical protein [Flavobacteriales bacterium]